MFSSKITFPTITDFKRGMPVDSESDEETPLSPASAVQNIVEENPFSEGDLDKKTFALLRSNLKGFATYPDTPKRHLKATKISETLGTIAGQFPETGAAFHKEATKALVYDSTWGREIIVKLKAMKPTDETMPRLVNLVHIMEGELVKDAPVGLHFCPPGSKERALTKITHLNPSSGVMCGIVQIEGKPKFSTLFPDTIMNADQLVRVIESGVHHAKEGNYSLYTGQLSSSPPFFFETITKPGDENFCVTTAYPIYECSRFSMGSRLLVQKDFLITPDDLLSRFEHNPKALRTKYHFSGSEIVDVAGLYPEQGIEQGIYLHVDTEFFKIKTPALAFIPPPTTDGVWEVVKKA